MSPIDVLGVIRRESGLGKNHAEALTGWAGAKTLRLIFGRVPRRWRVKGLIVCLTLAVLVSSTALRASTLSDRQQAEVSRIVTDWLSAHHVPGISVAVARDGEIWSAGFGKADLEQDVPVTPQSLFRTASVAKWFTATAAMRLVEKGRLDLDAPVQQYCPQFPLKQWPITSRELLTQMSGIRHYYGDNGEKRDTEAERAALEVLIRQERATQYTRYTDVIKPLDAFKNDPLLFQPGTAVHYSSLGYRLLGCVLQGAAQAPFQELMVKEVFEPAGMTSITPDDALAIIPHRVRGYSEAPNGTIVPAEYRDVSDNLPAGGYLATAVDFVRFALAFQSGKLVKLTTRDQMSAHPSLIDGRPAPNPFGTPGYYYGIGIMVDPGDDRQAWFHTGGQSGTSTLLFLFPKTGIVVAVLANRDGASVREGLVRDIAKVAERN
jgi:CubicO group peptidase (beta-lactamase class C family)